MDVEEVLEEAVLESRNGSWSRNSSSRSRSNMYVLEEEVEEEEGWNNLMIFFI